MEGNGRIAGLDGLRGVAVLAVVASHANLPIVRYGGLTGVALFFVLSGFLITDILIGERRRTGGISLNAFYARRALRLVPALVVALVGGIAIAVAMGEPAADQLLKGAVNLLYLGNLELFERVNDPFRHMWTLAMEEQFYLLWPMVLVLTARWRPSRVLGLVAAAITASLALRFTAGIDTHRGYQIAYFWPHTNVYALLLGAGAALWRAGRGTVVVPTWCWRASIIGFVVLTTIPGMKDGFREADSPSSLVLKIVCSTLSTFLAVGLVMAVVTDSPSLPRWLTSRVLLFFGTISYGLYLWHEILDWAIGREVGSSGVRGLVSGTVAAVLAVGIATLSHRWVELPFLRIKRRFER